MCGGADGRGDTGALHRRSDVPSASPIPARKFACACSVVSPPPYRRCCLPRRSPVVPAARMPSTSVEAATWVSCPATPPPVCWLSTGAKLRPRSGGSCWAGRRTTSARCAAPSLWSTSGVVCARCAPCRVNVKGQPGPALAFARVQGVSYSSLSDPDTAVVPSARLPLPDHKEVMSPPREQLEGKRGDSPRKTLRLAQLSGRPNGRSGLPRQRYGLPPRHWYR